MIMRLASQKVKGTLSNVIDEKRSLSIIREVNRAGRLSF
jgi:hypothetical protein